MATIVSEKKRQVVPENHDMKTLIVAVLLSLWAVAVPSHADVVNADSNSLSLLNRIDYSPSLTTAGQPNEGELALIASAGFDQVIFLAFTNHPKAVAHEDDIVRDQGLQFIHIPVDWESPSTADFAAFAAVMQTFGSGRTLVHCEVNFRASVFGFLYQVLFEGADVDEAMSLMQSIWVPNDTWEAFIVRVMNDNGVDYPAH